VRGRPAAIICAALAASLTAIEGAAAPGEARWRSLVKAIGVVDVVGPRADGRLVVATRGGLFLLRPGGALEPFARGADGYAGSSGEPYVALSPGRSLPGASCTFDSDDVFALDPSKTPGVIRVSRQGVAVRFVDFPAGGFPSGIAFDGVGRFGYRLLVTVLVDGKTTLYAIDCAGRLTPLIRSGPRVEGGIAVAPRSFGRFGGDLVAPDENTGRIFAFGPRGGARLLATTTLPAGGDIGVESIGFVPSRLGRGAAYLADLGAPGSPTEGTDSVLVFRGQDLARARLAAGELIAATEAGARTVAIRCSARCVTRRIADAPRAHAEGHVSFLRAADLG
jgi:hypothetical protein